MKKSVKILLSPKIILPCIVVAIVGILIAVLSVKAVVNPQEPLANDFTLSFDMSTYGVAVDEDWKLASDNNDSRFELKRTDSLLDDETPSHYELFFTTDFDEDFSGEYEVKAINGDKTLTCSLIITKHGDSSADSEFGCQE